MVTLATVGVVATAAGKVVAYGALLGTGFWISKKVTNLVDERFLLYDVDLLNRVGKESFARIDPFESDGSHEPRPSAG